MQTVICPNCDTEIGEAEDEGDPAVGCPYCGCVFEVDPIEDVAEMYRRQEEEDRDRWIPDRVPHRPDPQEPLPDVDPRADDSPPF